MGAATGLLIALCAALAWGLSAFFGVAPLSAYLATSPGGLDTIAVISSAGGTDMGLVMAMQTLRLFAVVACWPWVVRWLRGPGGV